MFILGPAGSSANNGNEASPDIRATLVACETNRSDKQDFFFASTPPLEEDKLLFSRFAREKRNLQCLQLSFVDVRKAYFNSIPKRAVYVAFPYGCCLPSKLVGKLVRCAYGTRGAGDIWEDTYRGDLETVGFVSGISNPCCVYIQTVTPTWWCMVTTLHAWFFKRTWMNASSNWYAFWADVYEADPVREADPRHVDLLAGSLGLTAANSVTTPNVKNPQPDYQASKHGDIDAMPDSAKLGVTDHKDIIHKLRRNRSDHRKISFDENVATHQTPANSEVDDAIRESSQQPQMARNVFRHMLIYKDPRDLTCRQGKRRVMAENGELSKKTQKIK